MFILATFIYFEKLPRRLLPASLPFLVNSTECIFQHSCNVVFLPTCSSSRMTLTVPPWKMGLMSFCESKWNYGYSNTDQGEIIKDDITSAWSSWDAWYSTQSPCCNETPTTWRGCMQLWLSTSAEIPGKRHHLLPGTHVKTPLDDSSP